MKKFSKKDRIPNDVSAGTEQKIIWTITAVIVLAAVVFGIITRLSYSNNLNSPEARDEATFSELVENVPKKKTDILNNLMKSEIIVKAEATGEALSENDSLRFTLKVTEVYKGNVALGEEIYLYSPNFFRCLRGEKELRVLQQSVVSPVMQGKEYLIFAKEKEFDEIYSKTVKVRTFLYQNMRYPYFPVEESEKYEIFDKPASEYRFKDFKNSDYIFISEKQKDAVLELRKAAFEKVEKLK